MSIAELQPQKIEDALQAFLNRCRPPARVRPQLDVGARVAGKTVEVFEIRPQWDSPSRVYRYPLAKATWVNSERVWRVYCQDSDLRWQGYRPKETVQSINEFLDEVERDRHGCFFG